MATLHPHKDDHGQPVKLMSPSTPSDLNAWADASQHATAIPLSPMPAMLNAIAIMSLQDPPNNNAGWERLAASSDFKEPAFKALSGKKTSSGVVVVEPDGRIWVVSPSNQFGGYTNWALSGGYSLTPGLRAVASTGTSFQAPTFNQLYFPGFGTPTLAPQINRSSEMGLKYLGASSIWSGVVYHSAVQGFIVPTTNIQSALAVLRGATLSSEIRQGDTRYHVSYDFADPRSYSSNPSNNDLRLVRIAQNVWQARVSHALRDMQWFAELKVSSSREDAKVVGSGRDVLPAYATLNVGTRWQLSKELSVLARMNNVTDTQYSLANGYTMPGRNLFVSLAWNP